MKKLFVILILASLLLLGCLGTPSAPAGGGATGAGGAAPAGTGAGAQGGNATAGAGQTGGAAAGGNQTTSGGNGTGGAAAGGTPDAASIASYAAAMASGLPLECTMTTGGQTWTIDIKGKNMYMSSTAGGQPYEIVVKDTDMYMKLSVDMKSAFAQMGKNCDWLLIKGNATASSGTTAPISTETVTAPDTTWSCLPGLFGDEKFLTPGAACGMNDLYPTQPTGGY